MKGSAHNEKAKTATDFKWSKKESLKKMKEQDDKYEFKEDEG